MKIGVVNQQISQNPPLKIGLVQGNIDQSVKWDESFQKETLKIYEKLSFKVAEEKPDLQFSWPETATPFFFQDARNTNPLSWIFRRKQMPFSSSEPLLINPGKGKVDHYNSAYLVSPIREN